MKLYNALTRHVETFTPRQQPVTIYVCGVTPYDTTHLGHAFTYCTFDVLIRYLEYQHHTVRYVQNVTDIDDDILRKANEVGADWQALGNHWTAYFLEDLCNLNVRPPEVYPRATSVITDMFDTIQQLIEAGVAYAANGNVYFQVAAWPEYGKLSRVPKDELLPLANQHGNNPNDPNKRNPLDFVLWQAQAPGEPAWESPWGPGRPGWHIECSTMATRYLGNTIDVHGGGGDLIFPHHESEIAQTECATGEKPFVRFWMHTAMVEHQGQKMSKSLGNLVFARDLLKTWSADAVRLYLSSHHYRTVWGFDEDRLKQSAVLATHLTAADMVEGGTGTSLDVTPYAHDFEAAMNNDLDTAAAQAVLKLLADAIIAAGKVGQNINQAQKTFQRLGTVLGLRLSTTQPEPRVVAGWTEYLKDFKPAA